MVTASTPAARTASKAVTGARKWNCFGSGVPRSVIAVSRLTMVKSASDRVAAIGPNAVAGCASSPDVRPVKWTSPAKARVSGPGPPDGDTVPGAAGDAEGDAAAAGACRNAGGVPHPASVQAPVTSATSAIGLRLITATG